MGDVTGATSYIVLRATTASTASGETAPVLGTTTSTSFTDNTVKPTTTYYYVMRACKDGSCSTKSPVLTVPIP